ncbi:MAG: hypothetical protein JW904_12825 [Spirochaetales bacterium]|nr:hypothetical protein [Spirochaetales bacterium]
MRKMVLYVIAVVVTGALLSGCPAGSNRVTSREFKTSVERVHALKKYYHPKTGIIDTEFDIFDVNMNAERSIPGASSRDFKLILYVAPGDIDAWIDTTEITSFPVDYNWVFDVSSRLTLQDLQGAVLTMKSEFRSILVLAEKGIVIIRIQEF